MRLFIAALLATNFAAVGSVNAQNAGINREFGSNGIASLRDAAQASTLDFQGIGACATSNGGLNVVSETNERGDVNFLSSTLSVFRLRSDGQVDPSFGNGGTIATLVPPAISINATGFTAIPIAEGRVLYGAGLGAGTAINLASYAAIVELGATAAGDRLDTRFGSNGAVQFAYRTPEPCADGAPTVQYPTAFSNWLGRPVLAGKLAVNCDATSPRNAFVARLLAPDDLSISGFESGAR